MSCGLGAARASETVCRNWLRRAGVFEGAAQDIMDVWLVAAEGRGVRG